VAKPFRKLNNDDMATLPLVLAIKYERKHAKLMPSERRGELEVIKVHTPPRSKPPPTPMPIAKRKTAIIMTLVMLSISEQTDKHSMATPPCVIGINFTGNKLKDKSE